LNSSTSSPSWRPASGGLEDGKWIVHFEKLPLAHTEKDLNDLLPQNTDPDSITISS